MRRAGIESGLLGFCRKVARDALQFANPLRPSSGEKSPRTPNARRRSLNIESLEIRNYLSGAGIAAQVDPMWFQEVAGAASGHAGAASWTTEGITASTGPQTAASAGASGTYDWIVQFDTQYVGAMTNIAETAALLAGGGIQFQAICGLGIVGQVLIRSSGASLETVEHWLAADEEVDAFEQDALRQIEATPNDASLGQLWGMSKIDAYGGWNLTTGSSGNNGVIVAVIDTGVDYTHSDLAANIWTNPNAGRDGFAGDLRGYDFANNDGDPMDDNGHGTHVAGTIGAVGNNGAGVAGVNWAVSIMPLKFMTASGSGYLSDAIRAINYATMQRSQYGANVRVINASWGGGSYSSAMQTAITAAGNAGILFVAAAGNDGTNNDASPRYPSGYNSTNIVAVAATDQYDRLASFSCYGTTSVDLAAPGVSIYSTLPGNRYGGLSGTSMATPHAAGAAALAWALKPNATVAEVRGALLSGVDRLGGLSGKVASGGRLNVFHTLQLLQGNNAAAPAPIAIGAALQSFTVSANNVKAGTTVQLVAQGPAASANSYGVRYYRDSNNNGVFDVPDAYLGTAANSASGSANFAINTSGWSSGTHRFWAFTVDSQNRLGPTATTTLTVASANLQGSAPPALQSFTVSANNVAAGTTVELVAQVPAAPSNTYGVRYYRDTNNNGVFDVPDAYLGTAANSATGSAKYVINTAGWSSGAHRFWAFTVDSQNRLGPTATTTLTVASAAGQGAAPTAESISAGATLAGKLDAGVKEGWYRFQAVAGVSYTIRTSLVTLRDSVLHLYDGDGKTLLAANDDGDSGLASKIDWIAPKTGTYFFKVSAFDKSLTGDFRVSLAANGVGVQSNSVAVVQAAGLSMGISRPIGITVHPPAGATIVQSANLGIGAAAAGDARTAIRTIDAAATSLAERVFPAISPVSRRGAISAALDDRENGHADSLVERHPALRSMLGSMLPDAELENAEPVQSMRLRLDALDELFARLAGGNSGG
ncbi:MAG: S8 family serine peptidase [Pirellulales bacterium]|nr:S8 family serine peptidase [Pirellulales bacterium]